MKKNLFPSGRKDILISFDSEFYEVLEEYAKKTKGLTIVAYIRSVIMNSLSPEFCKIAKHNGESSSSNGNGRNLTRRQLEKLIENLTLEQSDFLLETFVEHLSTEQFTMLIRKRKRMEEMEREEKEAEEEQEKEESCMRGIEND